MKPLELTIRLPGWVSEVTDRLPGPIPDLYDRMAFVVELSRQNVLHGTGGPFAAAVFDDHGRLIAPGVNTVISANCSILHAEMVAIALAQKAVGRYDLSDGGIFSFELLASTEPCAMCFRAIPWSGIQVLVCGARSADAIGFDEGPSCPAGRRP
jgi:tRNA(Arg) A34 adenosine deaminase TadA